MGSEVVLSNPTVHSYKAGTQFFIHLIILEFFSNFVNIIMLEIILQFFSQLKYYLFALFLHIVYYSITKANRYQVGTITFTD